MDYIIDKANVLKGSEPEKRSFLVNENEIVYMSSKLDRYKFLRMDVSEFFMTPGHVLFDDQFLKQESFDEFKRHERKLIASGCTTVVVSTKVRYEKEIKVALKKARHALINSSLDFAIGLHVPVSLLKPTTMRLCKKYKIPFLFVDISTEMEIESIPWGWIREALYTYRLPIYPIWKIKEQKQLKLVKEYWQELASDHSIVTDIDFRRTDKFLSKEHLKQIGVYPLKGEFLIGADVDYNLYRKQDIELVEENGIVDYDKLKPSITTLRGKVIKCNDSYFTHPGYGKELEIKIPGYFL